MRELIAPLVGYNYWANHRLLDTLATLPAEAYDLVVYYRS